MRYLRVKNWEEFQHYKDRNPPWIKLHRSLLDDYEFASLQDASKAHLMLLWLFASQNGGKIPEDAKFLQRKLGLEKPPDLKSFVDQGLLIPEQDASTALAECEQGASDALSLARSRETEKRREEERVRASAFDAFWQAYPRKIAKPEALKAWARIDPANYQRVTESLARHRLCEQWTKDNGQFIPHPATWLNQRRFEDDLTTEQPPRRVAL